jgi:hypothetical protein
MSSQADSFTISTRQNYEGMQVQLAIEGSGNVALNSFGASTYEIQVYATSAPSNILFYEDKKALSTNEEHVNISSGFTYDNATNYTVKVSALDASNADVNGNDEIGTLVFTYYDAPADFSASISSSAAQLKVSVSNLPEDTEPHITAFRVFGYNQSTDGDTFSTTIDRANTGSTTQTLIGTNADVSNGIADISANPNGNAWVDGDSWIVNIIGQTIDGNTYGTTGKISASGVIQSAPNDPELTVTTPLLANVTNGPQFSLVIVDSTPITENSISAWTKSSTVITQDGSSVTVVANISNTAADTGSADSSANDTSYNISANVGTLTLTLGPTITDNSGNTLTLDTSNPVTIAVKNSNTIDNSVNTMSIAEASFNFVDGTDNSSTTDISFTPVNDNTPTLSGEPDVVQPLNVPASVVQFSYAGVTTAMPKVVDASSASQFVQPHTWTIQASVVGGSTGTYEIDLSNNPPSQYSFNGTTGVGTLSAITLAGTDFSANLSLSAGDVLALSSFLTIELDSGSDLSGTVVETVDLSGVYRNIDDVSGSVSSITLEYPFTPNAPTLTVTNPASNLNSASTAQFIIKIEDGTPILDQSSNSVDISAVTLTITQGSNSAILSLDVTNFDSSASYPLGPDISGNDASGNDVSFTLVTGTDVSLSCTITNSVAPTASAATTTFTLNTDVNQNTFGPEINPTFKAIVTDGSLSAALTDSDTISKTTITVNLASGFTDASGLSDLYNDNGVSDINLTISALDTSGNTVLDSSGVTNLNENILLNISQNSDSTQIILKLTGSGNDNAGASWTDISLITSALTLIDTQLGITSLTAYQPAKAGTTLDCSMVIGDTSANISNYSSATATLYVNKNNDAAKPLALNTNDLANTIAVASVSASDVSGSDTAKTFSFDLSGVAQYLRGQALYVSATMTSAGSANSFTTGATDTSNALVYLYTSPVISYDASGISADISSNGYTVSSVFGVDNTDDGAVGLNIVYVNNNNVQTGDVSFNNQYNYAFDNSGNDNTIAYENTQINGIATTNTNILVHMTTTVASNKDEMQVKGSAALSLTN